MGRNCKAECSAFVVVSLEAYLHCSSELEANISIFLAVCGCGVVLLSQGSTMARAMKRTQLETMTQDSYFIGLWLVDSSWLGPATPEALLVSPPHQLFHVWQVPYLKAG